MSQSARSVRPTRNFGYIAPDDLPPARGGASGRRLVIQEPEGVPVHSGVYMVGVTVPKTTVGDLIKAKFPGIAG